MALVGDHGVRQETKLSCSGKDLADMRGIEIFQERRPQLRDRFQQLWGRHIAPLGE